MKSLGGNRNGNHVVAALAFASALVLSGCGGGGDAAENAVAPLAAVDDSSDTAADAAIPDDAAARSDRDGPAESETEETANDTPSTTAATDRSGDTGSAADADADTDEPPADDQKPKKKPPAPTDVDTELDVDPDLAEEIVVVTAPATTAPPPPPEDGVVFERIDPSPELPGMTRRPIRSAFADPANNSVLVVRFGGVLCDGFRTIVTETSTSVSVALEGVNTLDAGAECDDSQLYATELAAVLAAPIGDRTIETIAP